MQSTPKKESKFLLKLKSINKYLVCDIEKKQCELMDLEQSSIKKTKPLPVYNLTPTTNLNQ